MNRRDFLTASAALAALPAARAVFADEKADQQVMTVTGAVPEDELG